MGLGRLLTRSTQYTAVDTVSGASATYTVIDNLVPTFARGAYQGGMAIPAAYRASILLSDLLGQVPWDAYRKMIGQPETLIEPKPPLLDQPNPPETSMSTFSSAALDLIWHGNAVAIIAARNAGNVPTAAVPVSATNVDVRRVTPWVDSPQPVGSIEYRIGQLSFGSDEIIHIKGPCEPGALRGFGVLENHLRSINLAGSLADQAASISQHGVPTGVLRSTNPDLTDTEATNLKKKWLASQNSVAVLNAMTEFTPLSWNPEQLQLVEARQMSINDHELIFGLPVGWLGGMNSARQYSNIEQDAVNLLKFSLSGHLARFEQTLSLLYPRGTAVRADLDSVLRADTLTRFQAYAIALDKAFLSVDEVRAREHLQPLPEPPKPAMPDAFMSPPNGGPPIGGQAQGQTSPGGRGN
jgi:HK97 family phage portal protein